MRVLITGMSGTGKTAVIEELAARAHRAIDLDTSEWSEWIDVDPTDTLTPRKGKAWVWQEDKVRALLAGHNQGTLFVSRCAQNMARLFPLIDMIVLLSAPAATIMSGSNPGRPTATAIPRRNGARCVNSSRQSRRCCGNLPIMKSRRQDRWAKRPTKSFGLAHATPAACRCENFAARRRIEMSKELDGARCAR